LYECRYDQSSLIVVVAPEESLWSSTCCPLHEFSVIGGFDFFGGAAEHGEHRQADRADGEGG